MAWVQMVRCVDCKHLGKKWNTCAKENRVCRGITREYQLCLSFKRTKCGLIREGQVLKHFKYLRYITKHKWYVMVECWRHGLIWRGFIHDWSKFLPAEWFPYARSFYGGSYPIAPEIYHQKPDYTGLTKQQVKSQFDRAWLHHIHWNKHHWQNWVLIQDEDEDKVLPIPKKYLIEMLCDWKGAGRAQGKPDTIAWYKKHKGKIVMDRSSRYCLENMLHGG